MFSDACRLVSLYEVSKKPKRLSKLLRGVKVPSLPFDFVSRYFLMYATSFPTESRMHYHTSSCELLDVLLTSSE